MSEQMKRFSALFVASTFGLLAACGEPTGEPAEQEPTDDNAATNNGGGDGGDDFAPPLSSLESVVGDHPEENGEELPRLNEKFDIPLPERYVDLVELQSPVRSQGRRGVCSIFSTVGLMEHLYIKAGDSMPDFSEQYLQWSVKVQVGSFPNTDGSSGSANLNAITRFGVPEESAWPYEPSGWSTSDDEDCTGDERPTKCYTNGEPPESAMEADKFKLPRREWVSSYTDSLKTYMKKNERAVISGMSFYYQSWSHGGSSLGVNQENRRAGAVVFPSDADQTDSEERPAGHSILLVGWDDNKEFPRLDEEGNPLTDDDGNVIMDKGFFLFKNSWGTGGAWGSENEFGPGYGWLSYRYVQRWGRSTSSTEPEAVAPTPSIEPEICDDMVDNDGNDAIDCADAACADAVICQPDDEPDTQVFGSGMLSTDIPDDDTAGITSSISVDAAGTIEAMSATVRIDHSWFGDLDVLLVHPGGEELAVLHEANGDPGEGVLEIEVELDQFNDMSAAGDWELVISDNASRDTGTLLDWSLEFELAQ